MRDEAKMNEAQDKAEKERIDKLNAADSVIFQTEKQLKEYGDKIPADKKTPIETALNKLKEAHKNQDLTAIDSAQNELNTAWQAASEEIYKAQAQQGGGGASENPNASGDPYSNFNNNNNNQNGPDVTDVDFEEVK
jgi:molecular chaperone DnaK